jgi:hypothetical protein
MGICIEKWFQWVTVSCTVESVLVRISGIITDYLSGTLVCCEVEVEDLARSGA